MKNNLLIIALILFSFNAICQKNIETYNVKSLEGKPQKITVKEGKYLTIKYLNKTLVVNDYWAPGDIQLVNDCFLKINYAKRGGSCVGIDRVILLCISRDKLIVAMSLMDRLTGCGGGIESEYTLKFDITGTGVQQYRMPIRIHSKKEVSSSHTGRSYDKQYTDNLYFDPKYNVFSNGYKTLQGNFIIYHLSSAKPEKKYLKDGNVPMIRVKDSEGHDIEQWYVNGRWYERVPSGDLKEAY